MRDTEVTRKQSALDNAVEQVGWDGCVSGIHAGHTIPVRMRDDLSRRARRRFLESEGRGLLHCDWVEVVFTHYRIAPKVLQPLVPVKLDLWEGQAFVSLVAFTMRRLRPAMGGRLAEWLMRPFGTQRFLNLRSYVRRGADSGIYFLKEWNSSQTCAWLAPWAYGLPYCHAELRYQHTSGMRQGTGSVRGAIGSFEFSYQQKREGWDTCPVGSLDEFLLERYVAFASAGGRVRFFRVRHAPWHHRRAENLNLWDELLRRSCAWWRHADFVGANISPGALEVWMGPPRTPAS